jgi:DNA sulfur modification protein DndC
MDARRHGLSIVLGVQDEINAAARATGRPLISLINDEEQSRIEQLIEENTWPEKWSGDEPVADVMLEKIFGDGSAQPLLGEDWGQL